MRAGDIPIGTEWVDARGRTVRRITTDDEARRKRCVVVEIIEPSLTEPGLQAGARYLLAEKARVTL